MTRRKSATTSRDETGPGAGADWVSSAALPFAACFAYLPGGYGVTCDEGRLLRAHLKAADGVWLPRLAARVWLEAVGHERFGPTFGSRVSFVPVPASAPRDYGEWVSARLAWCLQEVGLGARVLPLLRRRHAVRKSAFAATGERPTVLEHHASLAVEKERAAGAGTDTPLQLTLVDDVITRGRTVFAAACRLREEFPRAEVRAFAFLRTLGPHETLVRILDPCEGEVRWAFADARRHP